MKESEEKPSNLKDVLREMKDNSELIVDLSYSAILFGDETLAKEVVALEDRMDDLLHQARVSAILGARRVEDAEDASGLIQIASAAEKISNAAGDIAKIVLDNIGTPDIFKKRLPEAEEVVTKVAVSSPAIKDKTLGELMLKTKTGMKVIAIRRGKGWIYDPDKDTRLLHGDGLIVSGPDEGVPILQELAEGEIREEDVSEESSFLGRAAKIIVGMKNLSELSVDLAYSAVLFDNENIAKEVVRLEEQMNDMKSKLEYYVLEAAEHIEHTEKLRGLLHLSISSEEISDAAFEIADVVLMGMGRHPAFTLAIRESDEVLMSAKVEEGSDITGKALGDLRLRTNIGMCVVAIKRDGKWIYRPSANSVIRQGDLLIAKGTRSGEELLVDICTS